MYKTKPSDFEKLEAKKAKTTRGQQANKLKDVILKEYQEIKMEAQKGVGPNSYQPNLKSVVKAPPGCPWGLSKSVRTQDQADHKPTVLLDHYNEL